MPTLTALPASIIAGDSYDITLSLAAYPASAGWTIRWALAGVSSLVKVSTPVGDAHQFLITTTESVGLTPGQYRLSLRAERSAGAIAETFQSGTITVVRDLSTATNGEAQSHAEQMLAICREARKNILAGETKMYMIDGRQTMFLSLAELDKEEARWRRELAAERRGSSFMKRPVTFVRG